MMQQANYLNMTILASHQNWLAAEIESGTGYISPVPRIVLPPPPFMGQNLTLNNINVSDSAVGGINTGTIQHLDATVTLTRAGGNKELADALQEFTQALHDTQDLNSKGLIKSALSGVTTVITGVPALLSLWNKLRALMESAL